MVKTKPDQRIEFEEIFGEDPGGFDSDGANIMLVVFFLLLVIPFGALLIFGYTILAQ